MNRKKYVIFSLIGIIIIIIIMIGFTYGFFMSRVKGNSSNTVVLESGEAELTLQYFDTEDEYHLITPGYTHYQMFTVTNTGNIEVAYSIFLENVVNEFVRTNDIIYTLYKVAYEGTVTENTNVFDYDNLSSCVDEPLDIEENYSNTCYLVSTNTFPTTKSSIKDTEIIKTPTYKYVYLLKYEYLNTEDNQDIDKGHIFRGKVQVYGKDSAEAVNIFNQNTLAYKILDNAMNNLNGTEFKTTPPTIPAQALSKQKYEKNNNYQEIQTQSNITTSKTFTYANDYTENTTNGRLTLTNAQSGVYSNIYENLIGKYIVSAAGSTAVETSSGLTTIYKVISTTSNSITYGTVATQVSDESVLSKTEENGGYSYYFRGGVKNNYVNFNNMCWRIVRIDGAGGIKLILASSSGECSNETLTENSGYIKNGTSVLTSNYGYKTKQIVTTSGETNTYYLENYLGSTTGTYQALESWFTNNNFDTSKLKQTSWCLGNSTDAYNNQGVKYTLDSSMLDGNGNQYASVNDYLMGSGTTYYYKNRLRMHGYGTTRYATLNCNDEGDQKYTSYIGLLTPDENALAGGYYASANYTYYLHDNALTDNWWLASLSDFNGTNVSVNAFNVFFTGAFSNVNIIHSYAFRPAVVLASNVEYNTGDGTLSNPYTIKLN